MNKTFEFRTPGTLEAPGPIGRSLRLGIGVLLAWFIYQWIFGGREISPGNTTLWGWVVFSLLLAPYVWERGLKRPETTGATPGKIQFLHFDGCPLAPAAKVELQAALDSLADSGAFEYEEVDLMAEDTPGHLRNWGSPTILVDGRDINGALPGDACGCRVYDRPGSVPSSEEIKAGIERGSER